MKLFLLKIVLLFLVGLLPSNAAAESFQNVIAKVINEKSAKALSCSRSSRYRFVVVKNPMRKNAADPIIPEDLRIIIGKETVAVIELPSSEAKNFSLSSVKKSNTGFDVNVEWGGGLYHYEIQFNFRCTENGLYLYRVKNENFSTTNPDSKNLWDKKETKITKIEPNLPIKKFVMLNYLQ